MTALIISEVADSSAAGVRFARRALLRRNCYARNFIVGCTLEYGDRCVPAATITQISSDFLPRAPLFVRGRCGELRWKLVIRTSPMGAKFTQRKARGNLFSSFCYLSTCLSNRCVRITVVTLPVSLLMWERLYYTICIQTYHTAGAPASSKKILYVCCFSQCRQASTRRVDRGTEARNGPQEN